MISVKSVQRTNKQAKQSTERGDERLSVPASARDANPYEFPSSVRLEGVFRRKGIKRLGQLDGASVRELRHLGNCGPRTITELKELLARIASGEFRLPGNPLAPESLAALLKKLDEGIAKLPSREREILLLRMGAGKGGQLWTLEEVGGKFGLTRERVRQIMELNLPFLRKEGGPALARQVREIADKSNRAICPLTAELFSEWLGGGARGRRFSVAVYVRLLGELHPEIPAWPEGQEYRTDPRPGRQETAMKVLRRILEGGKINLPLDEAFALTLADRRVPGLTVTEFLAGLKYARSIAVEFPRPDKPQARLRWLASGTAANAILHASDRALTLKEISARIAKEFGSDSKTWSVSSLRRTLTKSFLWLGPSLFGLRRHVRLSESQRQKIREDVHRFLREQNRPMSSLRIFGLGRFSWKDKTNGYELAEILREDKRFAEGRRLVFSLGRRNGR